MKPCAVLKRPALLCAAKAEESNTADDQANAWESDEKANAKTFKRNSSVAKPQAQVEARNIVLMWEVQIIQEYCSLGSLRKVSNINTFE